MTKVLIAEDNPVNLELLQELLQLSAFEIVEAHDGQEALTKMAETQPNLILMDISLPLLDGFAVISRIRQHPQFCHIPVVAVTAYAMKEDKERILAAGFNSYVTKPIDSSVLLREVQRLTRAAAT
jgi:two-component system, cell cycle response regulator DivK